MLYPRQAGFLARARARLGLSMAAVAQGVGYTAGTWWQWEHGLRRLRLDAYLRLRQLYHGRMGKRLGPLPTEDETQREAV